MNYGYFLKIYINFRMRMIWKIDSKFFILTVFLQINKDAFTWRLVCLGWMNIERHLSWNMSSWGGHCMLRCVPLAKRKFLLKYWHTYFAYDNVSLSGKGRKEAHYILRKFNASNGNSTSKLCCWMLRFQIIIYMLW